MNIEDAKIATAVRSWFVMSYFDGRRDIHSEIKPVVQLNTREEGGGGGGSRTDGLTAPMLISSRSNLHSSSINAVFLQTRQATDTRRVRTSHRTSEAQERKWVFKKRPPQQTPLRLLPPAALG